MTRHPDQHTDTALDRLAALATVLPTWTQAAAFTDETAPLDDLLEDLWRQPAAPRDVA